MTSRCNGSEEGEGQQVLAVEHLGKALNGDVITSIADVGRIVAISPLDRTCGARAMHVGS